MPGPIAGHLTTITLSSCLESRNRRFPSSPPLELWSYTFPKWKAEHTYSHHTFGKSARRVVAFAYLRLLTCPGSWRTGQEAGATTTPSRAWNLSTTLRQLWLGFREQFPHCHTLGAHGWDNWAMLRGPSAVSIRLQRRARSASRSILADPVTRFTIRILSTSIKKCGGSFPAPLEPSFLAP